MSHRKAPRLMLILFLVLSCFFTSAKPARALGVIDWISSIFSVKESTSSYSNAITTNNVNVQKSVSEVNTSSGNWLLSSMLGGEGMAQAGNLNQQQTLLLKKSIGNGLLGDISQGIVAMYEPPASSKTYVADVMRSARIIPEAQAQGLGFSALDPILETWKAFRNLAYLFFVVIFLVIGFMIMFRTKVGQAAITAQQAIPSVIIAMLAVTFSYAIAGFMIDIMYVVMYMLAGFFTEGPTVITNNIFGLVGMMFQGTDGTQAAIQSFMADALNLGFVGQALAWMSSLVGAIIIGIAIVFATFKVFFELVKTYVAVLVQIIFSPIILMMGAFPGKNVFGKWIKDIAGNLILWPVVLLCVLVQRMLTAPIRSMQGTGESLTVGGFMPPFLVNQGQGAIIPVIVGIGVLLVIPEIMQQVKKAMGVDEGVFGALASDAWKKVQNTGSTAIPIGAGAIGGGIEGGKTGFAYLKDKGGKATLRDTLSTMYKGYESTPDKGDPVRYGGMTGGFVKGMSAGKTLKTNASNLVTGQAFSNTNFEELAKHLQNPTDNKKSVSVPEPPPAETS